MIWYTSFKRDCKRGYTLKIFEAEADNMTPVGNNAL